MESNIDSTRPAPRGFDWVFAVRWILGLTITALLVHPILYSLVFMSIRGFPQRKTLLLIFVGVISAAIIVFRLFHGPRSRWQMAGIASLFVAWILSATCFSVALLDDNVGNPYELGPFFGACTLGFAWAFWFPAWPMSRVSKWLVMIVLAMGIPIFGRFARIDGLSGDESKIALSWRRAKPAPAGVAEDAKTAQWRDYAQFMGPDRDGVIADVQLEPDWEKSPPQLIWRQPIGPGLGAFAVHGEHAVTQEQVGDDEAVTCYETLTGKVRWQDRYKAHFEHGLAKSGPRATPTIHERSVYSIGATGILRCLDLESGAIHWSVDTIQSGTPNVPYGIAGSPLIVDNLVIVCPASAEGRSVAAYDRLDGKLIWTGGDANAGYSSPISCEIAGRRQIVVYNSKNLMAVDTADGATLWSHPWTNQEGNNCSQPRIHAGAPDQVFVSTGYGKGSTLLKITASDDKMNVETLWTSRDMRNKFSSSFIVDETVYGLDDGILAAIDLDNGKRRWKKDRLGHGQILLVGGKLLAVAETGDLVLLEVTPEGSKRLGTYANALEGKTWNLPAFAVPYLLVRNDHEAACYRLSCTETEQPSH